jgi:hypothetical protein
MAPQTQEGGREFSGEHLEGAVDSFLDIIPKSNTEPFVGAKEIGCYRKAAAFDIGKK